MDFDKSSLLTLFIGLLMTSVLSGQITMPSIFGDHMVLQQKQSNPVWGWSTAGETVSVSINGQEHMAKADENGYWKVKLQPIPVGGPYQMQVVGATSKFHINDILVGEVWICSGQSNMQWPVRNTNSAELAALTANYPNIRLITVPPVGTETPQNEFDGEWTAANPETVKNFSAVGYFFGRRLHHALDVPIGLIDNAWGGSSAEAWVSKEQMMKDPKYSELMAWWKDKEMNYNFDAEIAKWQKEQKVWSDTPIGDRAGNAPQRRPADLLRGQHRPANIYNGVLHPTIGYGIKGVIWYQGESNAARAYQYRDLFPMMIQHWREQWGQGDFPFYWVQLADFQAEKNDPSEAAWAELREAQTMTMQRLKNVGEAVIIDVGEGRDIHPRNKQTVGDRLSRWALAKDYNKDIQFKGPSFTQKKIENNKITITFNSVGKGLYAFDTREPQGFVIAGANKKFVNAQAKIISNNQMEIWSDDIDNPVAVRYAWAINPICNMYSRDGLPMTPFRTDEWPGITVGKVSRD